MGKVWIHVKMICAVTEEGHVRGLILDICVCGRYSEQEAVHQHQDSEDSPGSLFFLLNTSRRREGDQRRRSTVTRLYSA